MRAWKERTDRARAAGAEDLAVQAEAHLNTLMEQGRRLWGDLGALGRRFNEVDQQLTELQQQPKQQNNLDKDWALFEAEQELNELRRQAGLN